MFPPCKSGDEHDQGAFREMEIRDQRVDTAEAIVGIDEDVSPA